MIERTLAFASFLAVAAGAGAQPPAPAHDKAKHGQADHMSHRFENAEEYAKRFDDPARDAWQMPEKVIAALALKDGQTLVDIGSGTGYFAVRIARAHPKAQVIGSDIEGSMVQYLRDRAKKEGLANVVSVQSAADSPNLKAPVDVVLIVDTYHHLPNRAHYFRRLQSSLKPGGRVAIVDFRPEATMGPNKEFRFTAEKIRAEMAEAGFAQVEEHSFLKQQHFLIFAVR
jgi:cyclopropane fatty-acyl-phospholipid synthase-like methyltransferase